MANGVFNIARGRIKELYNRVESNDPSTSALVIVLLKANETEADLVDHDDLSALLGAAGNTEADFTNYARKVLTDTELAALPAPDDTNDRADLDIPDQSWASAGGTLDNSLTKFLVCYDPNTGGGTDSEIVPLTHHDFVRTTDGGTLDATIDAAGFHRSQ